MRGCEAVRDLNGVLDRPARREPYSRERLPQRLALEQFLDDVGRAVVLAVTLATVLLVGAFNYVLAARLSASATTAARARAEATVGALVVRNGRIVPREGPDAGVLVLAYGYSA